MVKLEIKCNHCNTTNRIEDNVVGKHIKCGKCHKEIQLPEIPIAVTSLNYQKEVLNWPGVTLLEFWSPTCGYCHQMAPAIKEIAKKMKGFVKVCISNTAEDPVLAQKHDVRGVPNFFIYKHGKKVQQIPGAVPPMDLVKELEKHI